MSISVVALVGASGLIVAALAAGWAIYAGYGPSYWWASPAVRPYLLVANTIRGSWPRLTHQLNLYLSDDTPTWRDKLAGRNKAETAVVRRPEIMDLKVDRTGVVVRVATVPTVGLAEFQSAAPHLAHAWKVSTVQARVVEPGVIALRATGAARGQNNARPGKSRVA